MEFYKTAAKYLHSCNIRFSKSFLRNRMQSHPNYPALVSFTDTLDEMGLDYSAVIADTEKYTELQYPLLAHARLGGTEDFILVSSATQFEVNNNALLQEWNGIAVMVKPGLFIRYKEHTDWLLKESKENSRLLLVLTCLAGVLISTNFYYFTVTGLLLMLLSIAGIAICGLLILHSMGKDNALTEQLCSADGNHGCDKVLHSKAATLWKGVSLGDVGLVYFAGISFFLAFCAITNRTSYAFNLLLLPFALSVLLSAFSLWYQLRVVKNWCRMCLIVVGIVLLQAIVLVTTQFSVLTMQFSPGITAFFIISLLIPAMVWLSIKPLILRADDALKNEIAVLKWKRNPDVFLSLLYQQRKVDTMPWEDDIILGNPNAPVQILIACNPYCGPCSRTHQELENLLHNHSENVGVTVRFSLYTTDLENENTMAVLHILEAQQNSLLKSGYGNPVDDWFQWMDLDKFTKKYSTKLDTVIFHSVLEKHIEWNRESEITHTPTAFINGFELPGNYKIENLNLLINPIIENITPITVVANIVK